MPTQEERQRIVMEFLMSGNPQAITDAINAQTQATQKLTSALEQTNQTQQKHAQTQPQHQQALDKTKNTLQELNTATYNLSAGMSYAGLGWSNLGALVANSGNGILMAGEGMKGLAAALGGVGIAAGAAAIGIGVIAVAIQKTTSATLELTGAITKLAAATSLSLGQTAREYNAFAGMFGGQAAGGILGGVANSQANLSAIGIMQQLNAARAAQGNPNFYNPLLQGAARMGVSTVMPGSTMFNPAYADPQQVLLQVANRLADVTDPNKRLQYNAISEQSFGKDFTESAQLLARELQYSRAHGGTDSDVVSRLQGAGMMGFNLSAEDQHDVDEFNIASNEFHQALTVFLADLGKTFLPALTGILHAGSGLFHMFGGGAQNGIPGVPGAGSYPSIPGLPPGIAQAAASLLFPGGPIGAAGFSAVGTGLQWLLDKLPHHAAGGPVPAGQLSVVGESGPELFVPNQPGAIIPNNNIAGIQGLLSMIPNIGDSVSQTLRDIWQQIDAIGGAAGLASRPLKDFIGLLGGLLNAWKGANWVAMQQEVLLWGQQVGTSVTAVINEIGQLEAKLAQGMPTEVINFLVGKLPTLPSISDILVHIVPVLNLDAFGRLLAEGGPFWELTHDRAMSIIPTVSPAAMSALLDQGGPYWEMTHDRSLSIIPTIDTSGVIAAINAIPTTVNVRVTTNGNASPAALPARIPTNGQVAISDRVAGNMDAITAASQATGVPVEVIAAIMDTENGGRYSQSGAGAKGFMQLTDPIIQQFGVDNPFDPAQNIMGGAKYLAQLRQSTGDWSSAAAAYFGAYDWSSRSINGSASDGGSTGSQYVSRFNDNLTKYQGANLTSVPSPNDVPPDQSITVPSQNQLINNPTPLSDVAQGMNVTPEQVAKAICGPEAYAMLRQALGRPVSIQEATEFAQQFGWNAAGGMNGFGNFVAMLKGGGVDFQTTDIGSAQDALANGGAMAVLSTPKHYFVASGFDPSSGLFNVGDTGSVVGGSSQMTLDQILRLGGASLKDLGVTLSSIPNGLEGNPNQPDGTNQNPVAVTVVGGGFGAGVGFGGGGGPNDPAKNLDDLIKKMQSGTVTIQDFQAALDGSDPAVQQLFQDINAGQDPVQAFTNDIGNLGQVSIDTLGDQLPQSTLDTLNAFGSMSIEGQKHFSAIESAINKMANTAVVGLGSEIPGASQDAGGSMNLLAAVTQDLKSKGLDPSNVSVGDLTDSLLSLGAGIPSLNPIIQSLTDKLNAIPRDVNVNITANGSPIGGSLQGDTSPGSSGPGGRNNIPAPGQGFNGSEPSVSASPPSAGGGGELGGSISLGGGGGGGHVLVMAEGGILNEPVAGFGLMTGQHYLMGESGPEAVVPLSRRGSSGQTVIIQTYIAGMDFSDPQAIAKVAKAVSDQIARNIRTTGSGRHVGMAI